MVLVRSTAKQYTLDKTTNFHKLQETYVHMYNVQDENVSMITREPSYAVQLFFETDGNCILRLVKSK